MLRVCVVCHQGLSATSMSSARWLVFYSECVALWHYYTRNLHNPGFLARYKLVGCLHFYPAVIYHFLVSIVCFIFRESILHTLTFECCLTRRS